MPDVSVVVPLYNQADYIEENIESLSKQSLKNFEVIVVNDGSSDNSLEIINNLKEKYTTLDIKIINQKNCGLSCARNRGISEAKSKYILPLDADDKLSFDALEKYFNAINADKSIDIVIADTQSFAEANWVSEKHLANLKLLPYENKFNYCGLFKKTVWEEIGGYKTNMFGGYEDWEFWINCLKKSYKFFFIKESLFFYRVKKESMLTESLKKDEYLKSKIILNNTDIYPIELVDKAKSNIYKKDNSQHFFYCNKTLKPNSQYICLEGSFSGYQNFGDILQLKEAISFHKKYTKFEPIVL